MTDRFLFQLPQFSSGLRIFPANEAIDLVGLDLAWSRWVNPNALLGGFEGHQIHPLHCVFRRDRHEGMRPRFRKRFGGRKD